MTVPLRILDTRSGDADEFPWRQCHRIMLANIDLRLEPGSWRNLHDTCRFQPGPADNVMPTTLLSDRGNGAVQTTQIALSGTSGSAIFVDGFDP